MAMVHLIFIGIRGSVLALQRDNGAIIWEAKLPGCSFVNLAWDDERVYALSNGEVFCLDAGDGRVLWKNPLKGFGYGLGAVLVPGQGQNNPAAIVAQLAAEEAARSQSTAHSSTPFN